jgi:uncharacterized membrane protein
MAKTNDLVSKLVEQDGGAGAESAEAQLMRIQGALEREGAMLRRLVWIMAGLWAGTILLMMFGYALAYNPTGETSSGGTGFADYILIFFMIVFPVSALVLTMVLIFLIIVHFVNRLGSGRREANLRLIMIEERLRRMDQSDQPK